VNALRRVVEHVYAVAGQTVPTSPSASMRLGGETPPKAQKARQVNSAETEGGGSNLCNRVRDIVAEHNGLQTWF
jgi:hypothetical protein